jgi:ubiquitin C
VGFFKLELYNILSKPKKDREAKASRTEPTGPISQRMPILVRTLAGKIIELSVYRNESIRTVKRAIEEKEGIHPDQQHLMYAGNQLRDHRTLDFYNVPQNGTLYLLDFSADGRLQLCVKISSGTKFWTEAHPQEMIYDIKTRIWHQEGIPTDQQRLIFRGRELEDVCAVKDYGLKDNAILHLIPGMLSN